MIPRITPSLYRRRLELVNPDSPRNQASLDRVPHSVYQRLYDLYWHERKMLSMFPDTASLAGWVVTDWVN